MQLVRYIGEDGPADEMRTCEGLQGCMQYVSSRSSTNDIAVYALFFCSTVD